MYHTVHQEKKRFFFWHLKVVYYSQYQNMASIIKYNRANDNQATINIGIHTLTKTQKKIKEKTSTRKR